jgi:hypothetical protein
MRSGVLCVAVIAIVLLTTSIPCVAFVDAVSVGFTIESYVIDVEVDYKTFDFVSTCSFDVSKDVEEVTWIIVSRNLEVTNVKLDGNIPD